MRKLLVVICSILLHFSATAQDAAAEQKAFMDYATPGPMHAMLARGCGNWKAEISFWMKPGAEPMKWTATAVTDMVMGGRYQRTIDTGSFMGMGTSGMTLTGYDNAKKMFFTNYIDNMGTGITNAEGKWDDAKKCIVFKGTMIDPKTKQEIPYRTVLTFTDDNHQKKEMFMMNKNGKEFKSMEILMTKV